MVRECSWHRLVAWLAPLALLACAAKPRPAFDPNSAPQGVGWFCYQHEAPGTMSVGVCYRDRDECGARATEDSNTTCHGTDQAFCTDVAPRGGHDVRCLATSEDCEHVAQGFAAGRPTQCAAVP
jgi:hypothetical protein